MERKIEFADGEVLTIDEDDDAQAKMVAARVCPGKGARALDGVDVPLEADDNWVQEVIALGIKDKKAAKLLKQEEAKKLVLKKRGVASKPAKKGGED